MFPSIMHLIFAFFVLLLHLIIHHPSHANAQSSCLIVPYTSSVQFIGSSSTPSQVSLYRINYDIINTNPDVIIEYIDIHITSAHGFYNYRMKSIQDNIQYSITLPNTLMGTTFQYWFTTAGRFLPSPNIYACDSVSTTFTAPTTGTTNPTTSPPIVRAPGAICPALIFTHDLITTGINSYSINFIPTSGSYFVEWVDIHILANGRFLNYRMTMTEIGFSHTLPLPLLELQPGTTIRYWFTYSIPNDFVNTGILPTRCDTSTYTIVINGASSICPLLTFTHDVIFSTQYGSQRVNWNVTNHSSIRATTVFVHITHSSGDYTYQMFISPQDPIQQSYYYILPQLLSQPNDTWRYSFTYNMDSGQTCTTETFTANV